MRFQRCGISNQFGSHARTSDSAQQFVHFRRPGAEQASLALLFLAGHESLSLTVESFCLSGESWSLMREALCRAAEFWSRGGEAFWLLAEVLEPRC